MRKKIFLTVSFFVLAWASAPAQIILSLEECRERAVQTSKELDQARIGIDMAAYDRKIARANYFPAISATGAYIYNNRDIALISDSQSTVLTQSGTLLQGRLNETIGGMTGSLNEAMTSKMNQLMAAIQTNPALATEYMGSPMWQTILGMLQGTDLSSLSGHIPDIATPVNAIGADINDALHPNLHNIWLGSVTLTQPVFAGGKIIYSNQVAALAEELAASKYDQAYADIIVDVDAAYWQIVSIASKKRLADSYCELLNKTLQDVENTIEAGLATDSDALQVRVKSNEAKMLQTKAANGLDLAKMLLCKRIGLPLDSEIQLLDEDVEIIPQPILTEEKDLEEIYSDRPETRSLALACEIYDRKAKVARADMMPTVALTANYLISNPNAFNGIKNNWNGGMFSAGVLVRIPIFHGGEANYKYRKAKTEVVLYQNQLDDAREKIQLQVSHQRRLLKEAFEKLEMTQSCLQSAEDNLRSANVGYEAGVTPTSVVLGAQTAWLSAHSEYIDAEIELQMAFDALQKAEGSYKETK